MEKSKLKESDPIEKGTSLKTNALVGSNQRVEIRNRSDEYPHEVRRNESGYAGPVSDPFLVDETLADVPIPCPS